MGILSATPVEKKIYKVDLLNQNNVVSTITVSDDGLYLIYYIKEGKTVNRAGRITNIIHNASIPAKSYLLFDMSEDNSSIKERIHFCQIQTIIDITENNAYKLALEHGFVGTLDDWLEAQKGPAGLNAYELAIDKGYFEGTLEEWLIKFGDTSVIEANKINKVPDSTPGNLAAFGADGSIYDSGIDSSNPTKVNVFIGFNSISNTVKNCIAKANDICIVKTPINQDLKSIPSNELDSGLLLNEPMEYTAYVYDGSHWRAMQGNYDASNVYIGQDLQSRYNIGNFKADTTSDEPTVFNTKNMSLIDFWNAAFVEKKEVDVEPPEDTKYGIIRVLTDIGSLIDVSNGIKTIEVVAQEETTIIEVPLGVWNVTSTMEYQGSFDPISKSVIVEDENVEYEVIMIRVGHVTVVPDESDWD